MNRKVVIAVKLLSEQQKERLRAGVEGHGFEAVFCEEEEEALAQAVDAEIIISSYPSLARVAKELKWLCTPYAGVDEYMVPGAFASEDAMLTNSTGAYGVTLAEHAVMVTIEILRRRMEYARYIAERKWVRKLPIRSIYGSRITLLGTGDIGQEIALRMKSFRPEKITGVNRSGVLKPRQQEGKEELSREIEKAFDEICTIDELDGLLEETDLLIMALPGIPETRHILNEETLARLPDGAVIVNIGRGSSVDEKALEKELRKGRLFASLDVFEKEPLPADSGLWDCPNLLITPHVAGDLTLPYTRDRIIGMFLEDLGRYCEGKPLLKQVNLKTGY